MVSHAIIEFETAYDRDVVKTKLNYPDRIKHGYDKPRRWHKEEDNDEWIEPRRVRHRQKVVLPERKAQPRQFSGMGGHRTASLIQELQWYEQLIISARIWCREATNKQDIQHAHERLESLLRNRARHHDKIRERLIERGYVGPLPISQ